MKLFIISYTMGKNLGAYASELPMEEFLSRWNNEINSSNMTLEQTKEFVKFMDQQE